MRALKGSDIVGEARMQVLPGGQCLLPMGDRCMSRHKAKQQVPEGLRAAQIWHLRYQDGFVQPSAVTVLRERAANLSTRNIGRRSPERRVQVVDSESPVPPPVEFVPSKRRPPGLKPPDVFIRNHPDIRPGEALVCKKENSKEVTYWAQSKLIPGVEQWRQLADVPQQPQGHKDDRRRRPQGILSPVPRKGVLVRDNPLAIYDGATGPRSDASKLQLERNPSNASATIEFQTEAYLPRIHSTIYQRGLERISQRKVQHLIHRRFAKSRLSKRVAISCLAPVEMRAIANMPRPPA